MSDNIDISKFGVGADAILDRDKIIVPISPRMDVALGGGVMEGSMNILTGKEKAGKSITALTIAANAQKEEYGARPVFFFNVEGRLKKRDLEGIHGLDTSKEKFRLEQSEKGNIKNATQFLREAERAIHEVPGAVVIIDSFSMLTTEDEMNTALGDKTVMSQARLLAQFCRKIATVLPVNDTIVVGITHEMANVAKMGRGKSYSEQSGRKLKYQTDMKMRCGSFSFEKSGEQIIGQKVYWEVLTSSIGPPGQKFEGYIKYGYGIDKERELCEICSDFGIFTKKGSWISLDENTKFQGSEKVAAHLRENPDEYNKYWNEVKELIGI